MILRYISIQQKLVTPLLQCFYKIAGTLQGVGMTCTDRFVLILLLLPVFYTCIFWNKMHRLVIEKNIYFNYKTSCMFNAPL